jgi:hypothetical protein
MIENLYLTPIDDNYATCERTKAVLRIHCGALPPSVITANLNIEPTDTVEIGVPRKAKGANPRPNGRVNLWMLDSEERVQSRDLRRHLDWVLDLIEPAKSQVILLRQSGIVMDLWCVWWSSTGQGGPTLWPHQMRRIAELDLEFSLDVSYYGGD